MMNRRILIGIVTTLFVLSGSVSDAYAQATGQVVPSGVVIQQITQNCQSLRRTLNQIHLSDGPTRLNSGQTYDFISRRLMAPLNSRLLLNKIDASSLVKITEQYDTALGAFASQYIAYDDQFAAAINIDCTSQPLVFYNALSETRQLRDNVHATAQQLNQLITTYEKAVDTIHAQWKAAGSQGNGGGNG